MPSNKKFLIIVFAFASLFSSHVFASNFPPICRSVGATIFSSEGVNSSDAKMSGITMFSDIESACKQGTIHQGTMTFDQCVSHLKSQGIIHQKFKASANCVTGEVNIYDQEYKLPMVQACSSGGIHAAEAFKLLCPSTNINALLEDETADQNGVSVNRIKQHIEKSSHSDRRLEPKFYKSSDEDEYALLCKPDHLTLQNQAKQKNNSDLLYLSDTCSAFHPKHGNGIWEWANGGFQAEFSDEIVSFPKTELVCEPEPDFLNYCRGPIQTEPQPFVIDTCSLKVSGKFFMNGKCWINLHEDGGYFMRSYESHTPYFVYVNPDWAGGYEGYWNSRRAESHAHDRLGILKQRGFCWFNDATEICLGIKAGGYLSKQKSIKSKAPKWIAKKPFTDEFGNKICEATSTQGIGIRFFKKAEPVFALFDVPSSLIQHHFQNQNGETYVPVVMTFDGNSDVLNFPTKLVIYDERINEFGERVYIAGRPDYNTFIANNLLLAKNLRVYFGSPGKNTDEQISAKSQLIMSLTGSAQALRQADRQC